MMEIKIVILIAVASAVIFGILGFIIGSYVRMKTSEKEIGSATQEATRIINNALTEAETTKKTSLIEAKDEIHRLRSEVRLKGRKTVLLKERNTLIKSLILLRQKVKI